jgi:iron complex transport system ATP-binding protein
MIELEMRDVTLGYNRQPVLRGISLKASPGEMVGLIGPNGSGKSTILKALSRVMQPQSGKITVNGRDITSIPRQELACQVGVVPQMPLLPSTFTAFEIVLMGRNPHLKLLQSESEADLSLAWRAMEKTGTETLANRYINELSGGEIQCVLIARVLVQETGAILLDEPTANLDIGRQVDIFDMIHDLCKENNLAVLSAVHDLNLAAQYCDRVILINRGRIHSEGTSREVITEENIREVYGAENCVYTHPANGLPTVLLGAHRNKTNGK